MNGGRVSLWMAVVLWCGVLLPGCADSPPDLPEPILATGPLKQPNDPLAPEELERFLRIVRLHPQQLAPEFSPAEEDRGIRDGDSATILVQEFRAQFRKSFDAERQGGVWAKDRVWANLLHEQRIAPAEFASLVTNVSCAIARVRLESRANLSELRQFVESEIQDLSRSMDQLDRIPRHRLTKSQIMTRTQAAIRLGHAVALQEFVQILDQVPVENCTLVRHYADQLRPLLASQNTDPLPDLDAWRRARAPSARQILPVEHIERR